MEDTPSLPVHSFHTVATQLWDAAPREEGDGRTRTPAATTSTTGAAPPLVAPDEVCGVWDSYSFSWMKPFIDLASAERLEETDFPPPRRAHQAAAIGARLCERYRDTEVRRRFAWNRYTTSPQETKEGLPRETEVHFVREAAVRGRLRWVGYIAASDNSRELYAGVEWLPGCLPAYREALLQERGLQLSCEPPYEAAAREAAGIHGGCVHGERLFYSACAEEKDARCTCERLADIVLETKREGTEGSALPRAPSLARALCLTFSKDLIAVAVPAFFTTVTQALTPLLLQQFVSFLESSRGEGGTYSTQYGVLIVLLFIVCKLIQPISWNKYEQRSERLGCAFRTATLAAIFEKCFTISTKCAALPELSAGRVLTAASTDVNNIRNFGRLASFLWSAPLELLVYIIMLFYLVGWSALLGFFVFLLSTLLQTALAHWESRIQARLSACTDRRLAKTNELLSGIRIVKTMGWEKKFVSHIEDDEETRRGELRCRRELQFCSTLMKTTVEIAPLFMVLSILFSYIFNGHALSAKVIFPLISIFGAVGFPIFMLPYTVSTIALFFTSCARLDQLLEADDQVEMVKQIEGSKFCPPSSAAHQSGAYDACFERATIAAAVAHRLPHCASVRHHGRVSQFRSYLATLSGAWAAWRGHRVPVELQWQPVADTAEEGEATPSADTSTTEANDNSDADRYSLVAKALLQDVQLRLPRGRLTVVVGATGSGKSTLLTALIDALAIEKGEVYATRSIAFAPQQAWIMQDTIEANITFFSAAKDPARMARAVKCCQLEADLRDLDGGLQAEIGEHGVNLSGGQKARVSLARAVYADRQVYLLDDPLAALDAHVGHQILRDVILDALRDKTRVLATHHLYALPHADFIVVVQEGRVVFQGDFPSYQESPWRALLEANYERERREERKQQAAAAAGGANEEDVVVEEDVEEDGADPLQLAQEAASPIAVLPATPYPTQKEAVASERRYRGGDEELLEPAGGRRGSTGSSGGIIVKPPSGTTSVVMGGADKTEGESGSTGLKLIEEEEKESGNVPVAVYQRFMQSAGGVWKGALVVGAFFLYRLLIASGDVWLSVWASHRYPDFTDSHYLFVYSLIVCGTAVVTPLRYLFAFHFIRKGGQSLHRELLLSVASAKVSFFDATPIGRVLNRFGKDIYVLDSDLPQESMFLLDVVWSPIISLSISVYSTPPTAVVVVAAVLFFGYLLRYFSRIVREIRRRGSIAESPMYSLLEEVLSGRTAIAAYGKAHVLFQVALRRLDRVYAATYLERVAEQWLVLRIELLGCAILLAVVTIGFAERVRDAADAMPATRVSLISLSLTMCLQLFWTLPVTVKQAALSEACMNSAQRILHYVDNVDHEELYLREAAEESSSSSSSSGSGKSGGASSAVVVVVGEEQEGHGLAAESAMAGTLELRQVDLRYRPGLPLVLQQVSFTIHRGEKVGVVGRTGSGKSTLLQAFLRLVDISGGDMLVCGRSAATYTLPALRRLFSLIPQDPLLFQGTVRSNVDPFDLCSDAEIVDTLRLVGLTAEHLAVDDPVQDGGRNISVGQRQLLCLARALLKKGSQFILLDEATANVDPILDRQVQRVVRESFARYTVVTIAHRLHTVAGCDRILVMDRGHLVEQGSPRELVQQPTSRFHRLVTQGAVLKCKQRRQQQAAAGAEVSEELQQQERQAAITEAVTEFLKDCI